VGNSAEPIYGEPPDEGPGEAIDDARFTESDPGMLRSSAVMAVGTIVSRITGVGRDIAVVAAIGFGTLADAYTLGNTLPNTIYLLLVGGALGAVFVPQLVRHLKEDADGGDAYANRLITLTGIVLLVLSVVSVLAAPWIVSLYVPEGYPERDYNLAVAFARFFLPQIFFYGLYTMLSQVLNSRRHFAMPMFAPIANNVIVVVMALGFLAFAGSDTTVATITPAQITWLGIGTTLGVVVQSLVLIPVLRRVSFRYRPRFDFRGYGLGATAKLAGWTVAMVLANQIALLVTTRLATGANVLASEEGTVAQGLMTFDKAYLVYMLPTSVITISIVTAMLPRMSSAAADGDLRGVADQIANGARLVGVLIVPAAGVLIVFGPILTTLVFNYGAGSGAAATYTGFVVSVFALGLLPFGLFYLLIRGWYALSDTRSPFVVTVVFSTLLVVFAVFFYGLAPTRLKVASLALGESVAYWLAIVVAWWWLSRRLGGLHTRSTVSTLSRMVAAGVVATATCFAVVLAIRTGYQGLTGSEVGMGMAGHQLLAIVTLAVGGLALALVYFGTCRLLRVREVDDAVAMVSDRLPFLNRRGGTGD
jgi:putative peptidoglycan lipid II flippase